MILSRSEKKDITIQLSVRLDSIDETILGIFRSFPRRSLKAHEIRLLLEREGIDISYGQLRIRLDHLSLLSLLFRVHHSRVYSYSICDSDQ